MNYDNVVEKLKTLEERIDIILMTMAIAPGASPEYYELIDRYKTKAAYRQRLRDDENKIKEEYWQITNRLKELETDYPNLFKGVTK